MSYVSETFVSRSLYDTELERNAKLERENAALKQSLKSQCETCEMKQVFDSYVNENKKLKADKERLDWLQENPWDVIVPDGETLRAAIDAAMKEAS